MAAPAAAPSQAAGKARLDQELRKTLILASDVPGTRAWARISGSNDGSKRYQLPGSVPSRPRAMTFSCSQWDSPSICDSSPIQATSTISSKGTPTAQMNTFERAQLDTINSQPTVGNAHRQYTGSKPNSCSGLRYKPGDFNRSANTQMSCTARMPASISSMANEVRLALASTITGVTSRAMATFDSTVCTSETGSDFQNSRLRSRRSSYRALRQ